MTRFVLLAALVSIPAAARAQTQQAGGPPPNVPVEVGPLFLNPTLALTNAGVDNNVFNEAVNPKNDFTVTVTPAVGLWLRFGRTWLRSRITEDIVYYQTYSSESSVNGKYQADWFIPLNRLTLDPGVSYLHTRERPGFEIDARSERTEFGQNGTIEIQALSKTYFGVRGDHRVIRFDSSAVFLGNNLHDELNRTATTGAVTVRHQLTPLTALTLDVSREEDRFDFSPLRDSDSTEIKAGVKFDPAALLKGSAVIGYRDFKPRSPDLAGYHGSTAAVDLTYVALGTTKLDGQVARDVQYSYDINQPYYVLTGVNGSIAQQIFGPIDAVGRAGYQRLDYRTRAGAVVVVSDRVDHVTSYGGGVGYRLGPAIRVGFNVDWQRRTSAVDGRQYNDLRYGVSANYGTQ